MGKFVNKLAKSFILANYRTYRVEYPNVVRMTVNIAQQNGTGYAGLRHFNRDLAPGLRLANDELQYVVRTTNVDKSIAKPTIDIEFSNGQKKVYDAFGKDSVTIYYDLIKAGQGRNFIQTRPLPALDKSRLNPELTAVE